MSWLSNLSDRFSELTSNITPVSSADDSTSQTAYDDEVEGTSAIRSSQGVDPNQDSVERQQKHGASVKQSEIERIDADFEMNKPKTTDMQLYIDYEKMKNEMKLLQQENELLLQDKVSLETSLTELDFDQKEAMKQIIESRNETKRVNEILKRQVKEMELQLKNGQMSEGSSEDHSRPDAGKTDNKLLEIGKTDTEKVLEVELEEMKKKHLTEMSSLQTLSDENSKLEIIISSLDLKLADLLEMTRGIRRKDDVSTNHISMVEKNSSKKDNVLYEVNSLEQEIINLEVRFQELEREYNSLSTQHRKDKEDQERMQRELSDDQIHSRAQIQTLCDEQTATKEELESAKSQIFGLLQKLSCARSDIISTEEQHRSQVAEMCAGFEKSKTELQLRINKAKLDLQVKDVTISDLESRLQGIQEQLDKCYSNLKLEGNQNATVSEKLDKLEKEFVILKQDNVHLRDKISCAESSERSLENEVKKLTEYEEKYSKLIKEHGNSDELNKELMMKNQLLQKNELAISELNVKISDLELEISQSLAKKTDFLDEQRNKEKLQKEIEEMRKQILALNSEGDEKIRLLEKYNEENSQLRSELARFVEKDARLERECERLRNHLLKMEEGYTREALEAEEREKMLRNDLALLEEKIVLTTTAATNVRSDVSKQVDQLQQQLISITSQRDDYKQKLSEAEKAVTSYSGSLANLQIVLEQFQTNQSQLQSAELEKCRYNLEAETARCHRMEEEVHSLKIRLNIALDELKSAQKRENELELRNKQINALQEQVRLKEESLVKAEEKMCKLNSDMESKIDKIMMKNMLLGYFHVPTSKRPEALQIIGHILDFTDEEFANVCTNSPKWLYGIRRSKSASTSSVDLPSNIPKSDDHQHTFSELFIKFLERESSPMPQLKMPTERMIVEQHQKHQQPKQIFFPPPPLVPSSAVSSASVLPFGDHSTANSSHPSSSSCHSISDSQSDVSAATTPIEDSSEMKTLADILEQS